MSVRLFRAGGMTAEAEFVASLRPVAVVVTSSPMDDVVTSIRDSDTLVRSIRRSGLRYVACLIRSSGYHVHAADYLERAADAISSAPRPRDDLAGGAS